MTALPVDCGDEVGQGHAASNSDLLEPLPERILEADTRLMPGDHDRAFDDRRFHLSSPSIRCARVGGGRAHGAPFHRRVPLSCGHALRGSARRLFFLAPCGPLADRRN